jgi:hypothetical protein
MPTVYVTGEPAETYSRRAGRWSGFIRTDWSARVVGPRIPHGLLVSVVVLSISTLLLGCSSGTPAGSPEPSVAGSSATTASEEATASPEPTATTAPTASPTAEPYPEPTTGGAYACNQPFSGVGSTAHAQITDVRVGTHDGYDRIVFEFGGGIPAFSIEIVEPPFTADPSGLPLDVAGNAFLRIQLTGGTKVTPDGSLSYTGPTDFQPGFDELVELIEGGDFEALSTWYVGLDTQPCLDVFTISDGPRLVIDIEH